MKKITTFCLAAIATFITNKAQAQETQIVSPMLIKFLI